MNIMQKTDNNQPPWRKEKQKGGKTSKQVYIMEKQMTADILNGHFFYSPCQHSTVILLF